MVRDHHPEGDSPRQLLECQRADQQDRAVSAGLRQDQSPVQLESYGGLNPGEAPETLFANLRDGTLAPARE